MPTPSPLVLAARMKGQGLAIGPACRAVAQVVCGADGGVGGVVAIGPAWCVVPQVAGGRDEWSAVSG